MSGVYGLAYLIENQMRSQPPGPQLRPLPAEGYVKLLHLFGHVPFLLSPSHAEEPSAFILAVTQIEFSRTASSQAAINLPFLIKGVHLTSARLSIQCA